MKKILKINRFHILPSRNTRSTVSDNQTRERKFAKKPDGKLLVCRTNNSSNFQTFWRDFLYFTDQNIEGMACQHTKNHNLCNNFVLLFRPLLSEEELYTQMGFFVQSILADRYIHRRELRLVSLERLSSAEYEIKKIFLIFVFVREISRFKLSRK